MANYLQRCVCIPPVWCDFNNHFGISYSECQFMVCIYAYGGQKKILLFLKLVSVKHSNFPCKSVLGD